METRKLGLTKLDGNDFYDVETGNKNLDKINEAVGMIDSQAECFCHLRSKKGCKSPRNQSS